MGTAPRLGATGGAPSPPSRRGRLSTPFPGFLLWGAALLGAVAGSAPAAANSDGPLPGFSGGFGQATCQSCHFDAPEDPEEGGLLLEGVPETYRPGERYALTVVVRHPELARGGFQLTARFAEGPDEGHQAGILRVPGESSGGASEADGSTAGPRVEVVEHGTETPLLYARQTLEGAAPTSEPEVRWSLEWQAPAGAGAPVIFHAAGNAGNHDDSAFGDVVFTATARSEPGGDGP